MIEPMLTEKQCRTCLVCKPVTEFYAERAVCKPCRNRAVLARRQELRDGAARVKAPTDFHGIPAHDYTDDDRAWQAANLPVFNRGLLTWRFA